MPERQKLLRGFESFYQKYYEDSDLMDKLVHSGANPEFFIIHCIDPRSGAGKLFDADPGTLFGDRVMAALVPPYKKGSDFSASFSYAIKQKQIKHLIILGHTECGGIQALAQDIDDPEIAGWMKHNKKAFKKASKTLPDGHEQAILRETERQAIILSLKNLLTYPVVKQAFLDGKITLNGWLFDMKAGAIFGYEAGNGNFERLTHLQETAKANPHIHCGYGTKKGI